MYKELYLHLFNKVTEAIWLLKECNGTDALHLLIAAQQECEELYLQSDEE